MRIRKSNAHFRCTLDTKCDQDDRLLIGQGDSAAEALEDFRQRLMMLRVAVVNILEDP